MDTSRKLELVFVVVLSVICITAGAIPPQITENPDKEITYKTGESVLLQCDGQGDPVPSFSWKKDGNPLNIDGPDIQREPGNGGIVIAEPLPRHEGVYQCFASNTFGVAVSISTVLRRAFQEPFPELAEPKVHKVSIGKHVILRCTPPRSYPPPTIFWVVSTPENRYIPFDLDSRKSMDYNGNLHFANIVESDGLDGLYLCNVRNAITRTQVSGEDQRIVPEKLGPSESGTPPYAAPSLMWSSATYTIGVKHTTERMKCIFSGFPTPIVRWTKADGSPLSEKVSVTSDGQEMIIPDLEYSDQGRYRCHAGNLGGLSASVTKDFGLTVESTPFWVKEPTDMNSTEGNEVEIVCQAGGKPKPTIEWYINGENIKMGEEDSHRTVTESIIYLRNLTSTDTGVFQCIATNMHGYIFANVYLNVPAGGTKVAEVQTLAVVLLCLFVIKLSTSM